MLGFTDERCLTADDLALVLYAIMRKKGLEIKQISFLPGVKLDFKTRRKKTLLIS